MSIFRRFLVSLPILVLLTGSLAAYWPLNDASASLYSAALPEPSSLYATGTFTTTLITDQSENLNATNSPPLISADGSSVVLLVPGSSVISSTTASYGFALYDLASRQFSPVSFTASRNEPATASALSTDGRYVAFASSGANFVANDTNGLWDVFVFDREAGVTSRVSVASNGTEGNGESGLVLPDVIQTRISLSADGRYVAFTSDATNLVANDTNNFPDVFVHDRQTGMTSRVSVASNGEQGLRDSYAPSLSADGRYVAFVSNAFNFAESRPGVDPTVYVHDRETGQTTPVSVTSAGDYVNNSYWPVISADGRYVAFVSTSPLLVPPGHSTTERLPQIYIHDRETGETTLVSRSPEGTPGNARSDMPSLSAHGRYVAYDSSATNLVAGGGVQGQALYNIYVHDRQTGLNRMVSVTSDGSPIPLWSRTPSISGDGRSIAFAAGRSVYVHQPDYESDEEGGQCFPPGARLAPTEDSDGDGLLDQWDICEYDVNITYLSTHSFIVSDEIILKAQVSGATSNTEVQWTVIGLDSAENITGFPENEKSYTDNNGIATFTFTPSTNQRLVNDRYSRWTKGSRVANLPISFEVVAKAIIGGKEIESRLSSTGLGPLKQDEIDILRQEYYDYKTPIPNRDKVVPSLGGGYNQGNYAVQISDRLPDLYQEVVNAYHGKEIPVDVDINGEIYHTFAAIPDNAGITISSGYRNPQRNKAVGSKYPNSKHVQGIALDLVPNMVQVAVEVMIEGQITRKRVTLDLHKALYPALATAGSSSGKNAICEKGSKLLTCGDESEDHVHVNWAQ